MGGLGVVVLLAAAAVGLNVTDRDRRFVKTDELDRLGYESGCNFVRVKTSI